MRCEGVRKMVPFYQTGSLDNGQLQDFLGHVRECPGCSRELKAYEAVWHVLGKWEDHDPDPAYIFRLWTQVSLETPWQDKAWKRLVPFFSRARVVPALVTVFVVVMTTQIILSHMRIRETEKVMTTLSTDEMEFIKNIDVLQDLDVLTDLDFLQDYEIIARGAS